VEKYFRLKIKRGRLVANDCFVESVQREHPLAQAVVNFAKAKRLLCAGKKILVHYRKGVVGDGEMVKEIALGNAKLMEK
jgi:cation transport ATPase